VNIEQITKLIKLLRPKYYNILTRILVVGGLTLLVKSIWVDILNLFLEKFKFSIIGEFDWLLGLIVIIIALTYNTIHRYLELKFENTSEPAFKKVVFKHTTSFGELCQEILPLVKDNEYIFKATGPNSSSDELEPLRTDLTMWEKLKREAILPNNEAIKRLIVDNKQIIPEKYTNIFNQMLLHINAFNEHIINPNFDYSEYQFPKQFPKIILTTCFETAKTNKELIKKTKWISKKLHKNYIADWFIFGSMAFIPDKANDVDIAILVDKTKTNDSNELNRYILEIKCDFKLKFQKDLHVSIFDNDSSNEYSVFSFKNPLKIDKPNG
jgi:predicted nucleotidyltransferase